jgi:hypothetical protein
MLDLFGILVSTVAIMFIIVRAAALDRTLPWFETEHDGAYGHSTMDDDSPESDSLSGLQAPSRSRSPL